MLRRSLELVDVLALLVCALAPAASAQCGRAKLTADDGAEEDRFGCSVSVSESVTVVGARWHSHLGYRYGAAYVFELVDGVWAQVAEIAPEGDGGAVGQSVAGDGEVIVIGAQSAWTYVFEAGANHLWGQAGRLQPDDYTSGSAFGHAVAVSDGVAIVGAPHDNDLGAWSGSAYVFEREADGAWPESVKLLPADGHGGMQFGDAVAIDGNVAVIGAQDDNDQGSWSGSAYVFERGASGNWEETAKLLASDGGGLQSFGFATAVSGDVVLIGAIDAHGNDDHTGAVYVFEPDPNGVWTEVAKLISDDGRTGDRFGCSVALDSNIGVLGAYGDDDNGAKSGAAYVFVRQQNGAWSQVAKLVPDDGARDDHFGHSVAVSGNTAIIGAYLDDDNGEDSGSAYIFAVGPDEDGNGIMDVCECIGDLDGDYQIDTADLLQLLRNYGTTAGATYEDGDLDLDGDVDLSDLAELLGSYGTECW